MKKTIVGMFAVLAVGMVLAGGFVSQQTVAPIGATSVTIDNIMLSDRTEPFRAVEEFGFKNATDAAVSATLYTVNMGDAVAIATLSVAAGATAYAIPQRGILASVSKGFVSSNDTVSAVMNYVTNYVPYNVRTAKLVYTLSAQAVPTTNWFQVKAK